MASARRQGPSDSPLFCGYDAMCAKRRTTQRAGHRQAPTVSIMKRHRRSSPRVRRVMRRNAPPKSFRHCHGILCAEAPREGNGAKKDGKVGRALSGLEALLSCKTSQQQQKRWSTAPTTAMTAAKRATGERGKARRRQGFPKTQFIQVPALRPRQGMPERIGLVGEPCFGRRPSS